jgi:HK97 gp10 family phage protein
MAKKEYVTFKVEGLKEIDADLKRMGIETGNDKSLKAMKATMGPVAGDVRGNIPVAHGELKKSVRITANKDKRGLKAEVRAGAPAPRKNKAGGAQKPVYALQVEYGADSIFGKQPERPFMRPAFDGKEEQIANRLKRLLSNLIIGWKLKNKL